MIGSLYIHIGLHKTATSSLQSSLFPKVANAKYIGRKFRQLEYGDHTYQKLISYCFLKDEPNESDLKSIIIELTNLSKCSDVILSDEWFTTDYDRINGGGAPWQVKIKRLSEICALLPINVEILVTIREPSKAISSIYSELIKVGYGEKFSNIESFVLDCNDARPYNYPYFLSVLKSNFNIEDITFVKFEELLKSQDEFVSSILRFLKRPNANIKLKDVNSKTYDENKVHIKKVTWATKIVYLSYKVSPIWLKKFVIGSKLVGFLYSVIDFTKSNKSLDVPDNVILNNLVKDFGGDFYD